MDANNLRFKRALRELLKEYGVEIRVISNSSDSVFTNKVGERTYIHFVQTEFSTGEDVNNGINLSSDTSLLRYNDLTDDINIPYDSIVSLMFKSYTHRSINEDENTPAHKLGYNSFYEWAIEEISSYARRNDLE